MMSLFSDEIQRCIDEIQHGERHVVETAANNLLTMNNLESQAALCSMLDMLKRHLGIYWTVINGLGAQNALDAPAYYEKVMQENSITNANNYRLQFTALSHLYGLDSTNRLRILLESLSCQIPERLLWLIVSMLAEQYAESALYRLVLLIRQHPSMAARRAIVRQIVPRFEADVLIPVALGMIHTDSTSIDAPDTALILLWQCITQNKIDGYEAQVVLALQYCLYSLPDLGVMPYRCLMEINTPEAKAALAQWDVDNKSAEVQFFR
jgi:hypothetical protein